MLLYQDKHPFPYIEIPFAAGRFSNQLRTLRDMAEYRITWTAPKAMAKERRLHDMWTENLEASVKVTELRARVQSDQETLKNKLSENVEQLEVREKKITQMNEENKELIARTMFVGLVFLLCKDD